MRLKSFFAAAAISCLSISANAAPDANSYWQAARTAALVDDFAVAAFL